MWPGITTDELTLRELDEAGLLMDLTELFGEEKLYPAVRGAVTVDGRMMGGAHDGLVHGRRYRMQWLDGDPYGLGKSWGLRRRTSRIPTRSSTPLRRSTLRWRRKRGAAPSFSMAC